jgi:heme-degrading monooxygenase HmoA
MFARVSTYRAADAEKLLAGFQSVADPLEQMDGFSHAYFLVDRASGKGMSITVWQSEQALSDSVAKADELRKQGTETGGGSIESVEHYEIGLTVGTPATAG